MPRALYTQVAAFPTMTLAFHRSLKLQHLPLFNLILLLGPWLLTVALVFMAPRRSRQYMLTLSLFQVERRMARAHAHPAHACTHVQGPRAHLPAARVHS